MTGFLQSSTRKRILSRAVVCENSQLYDLEQGSCACFDRVRRTE